ncbi:restriction endonuclease subunit S, partial [Escherichia coli]|nr:restriction endonuclease subunit S [Escherichia coli]
YLLQWDTKALKDAHSTGSTMLHISKTTIEKRLVPIPCPDNPEKSLAIQSEIVRILDKFTALTAELTAELNMRKKQYNYYRDQLLSFDEEQEKPIYLEKLLDGVEVEWKTLGSIAELKRGTSITKKDVIDGTIPVVAGGRTPAYYHNTSNRDGQTIVIAGSGAYAGFVSWWEEPIFVSDAFTVKPHNILLPRYCYHFLMNMQQQLHEFKSGGGVPHVYPRDVSPILIPIPCPDNPEKSLAIQSEIVRILDKFDTLTNSITEGLPREIELRQKQYEYYRDLLFSFPKPEAVSN